MKKFLKPALFLTALLISQNSLAREQIRIVGSSTVFPFTATIAEEFSINNNFKTPIVESFGTGGGFKIFCSGIGERFPDFANASRKISESELEECRSNGIKNLVEIKIGYDGIVLANSKKAENFSITTKQLFLALSAQIPYHGKLIKNPYSNWKEIDKSFPNQKIKIYGPPPTSGTRDSFVEMVLQPSCMNLAEFKEAYPEDLLRKRICRNIRNDGVFIEAGENDNIIVKKLMLDQKALGVFGFSFLEQNKQKIQGTIINGSAPNFETIHSGQYELSRPLFIYFKKENYDTAPNIKKFIKEIINPKTIGINGYLTEKGLIPMHEEEFKEVRKKVLSQI